MSGVQTSLERGRDFGGLYVRLLLELVEWQLGQSGVTAVLTAAGDGRPVEVLSDDATWHSYQQFRRLLTAASECLGSPEELLRVGDLPTVGAGSKPEVTALYQAFGSPMEMTLSVGDGAMSPAVSMSTEVLGPTDLVVRYELVDGLEPFVELCRFLAGLAPLSCRIFGIQPEVSIIGCVHDGDEVCATRLVWDETVDLSGQLEFTRFQLGVAESRLEFLQRTVGDIVSTDDLDTVMGRIVEAAGRSMTATGFVLEVKDPTRGGARLYAHGVDRDLVTGVVELADAGREDCLIVDVASGQRTFGRFIVVEPAGGGHFGQPALQSYARLAATALESAFALEEARRHAAMSRALLELSTSLAELSTPGELATRLVQAMPAVIDCDCALVMLVRDGVARVAAHYGFESEDPDQLNAFEGLLRQHDLADVVVRSLTAPSPRTKPIMEAAGLHAMAAAPILLDGVLIGVLVAGVRSEAHRIEADPFVAERFKGLAGHAAVALRNSRLVDQIRYQSLHDPLTDLPNRALILDRAGQMMARAERNRHTAAVLFIDLDGFKEVNDTLGHGSGDELLQQVSGRLSAVARRSDTVGRIGGDEFVVLVEDAVQDVGVEAVAQRMLDVLGEPFQLSSRERPIAVQASIGIAIGEKCTASEMLRDADIALYAAKAAGKGCYRVFAPEMQEEIWLRAELSEALAGALERDEFYLVYQPILDLDAETTTGVEALLRWNHPDRGLITPDEFIPLLEQSGHIVEVGKWVIDQACRQAAEWHREGLQIDMSVNASIRQLERADFPAHIAGALHSTGLPPRSLIVEITETAIMRDTDSTVAVLHQLKKLGVRVAIDDFGTGYSSLAYLRQFPVDALKIDRSFIATMTETPAAGQLIHTLVQLGKALQLETLAEGIEHHNQLERLQVEGCASGQGYMFSAPLPATEVTEFLRRQRRIPA
jgi:diguanylate cyclase (GGDEF)-like protein